MTILLIEDDPDTRYVVSERLAADFPDARILAADSAEGGLELAARTRPAVIVLDLRLRGMEGFAFAQRARQLTGNVPIVVLTGDDSPATRARAAREGLSAFLLKPTGIDELGGVIRRLVK